MHAAVFPSLMVGSGASRSAISLVNSAPFNGFPVSAVKLSKLHTEDPNVRSTRRALRRGNKSNH